MVVIIIFKNELCHHVLLLLFSLPLFALVSYFVLLDVIQLFGYSAASVQ